MDIYDPQFRELLSAFQDGELDAAQAEEIAELIASDPEAREMFEQYERLRAVSTLALCPTDEELGNHIKGRTPSDVLPAMEAHLGQCIECRTTMKRVATLRGTPAPQPSPPPAVSPQPVPVAAAIAATPAPEGAAAIVRKCTHCGKSIDLTEAYAGETVKCPSCGEEVPPGIGETIQETERVERSELSLTAIGWVVSLIIHLSLILGAGGMMVGYGPGSGDEGMDIGIVGDEGTEIEEGDSKLQKISTSKAQLKTIQEQPTQINPIQAVGSGTSTGKEAILALDMGAGGGGGVAGGDWSAFSAASGGAGGGGASFFGLEARGRNFVFVVDYSGSMDGPRLQAAKTELIRSISALKRNMKFLIIFYDHEYVVMPGGELMKATEATKRRLFAWVDAIRSAGGTDPSAAMKVALAARPDAIWLLSDGEFDRSTIDVIRQVNPGGRTQIHTVAFQSKEGERLLRRIAEQNRGQYRFVP